jgi:hypothetical protein
VAGESWNGMGAEGRLAGVPTAAREGACSPQGAWRWILRERWVERGLI